MPQYEIEEQVLRDALYECDIEPDEQMRTQYSGRAMYDDTCLGLVITLEELLKLQFWLGCQYRQSDESTNAWDELAEAMQQKVLQDRMGYATIWYFPKVKVVEG